MYHKIEEWSSSFENNIATKIVKSELKLDCLSYNWCSYLLIADMVHYPYKQAESSKIVTHLFENKNFLDDLEGWNGGITFTSFILDTETQQRKISIGHDYVHLWDYERGRDYIFEEIERDILKLREQAFEKFRSIGLLG